MSNHTMPRRVVVTGYGAVTPLGASADACWASIMAGRLGYRYVDMSAHGVAARFFGLIDDEPTLKGVPAAIRRRLPRHGRLSLVAAREAMAMAFGDGHPLDSYDPLACGAIIGTGWGARMKPTSSMTSTRAPGWVRLSAAFSACPARQLPRVACSGACAVIRTRRWPPARPARLPLAMLLRLSAAGGRR